MRSSERRPAASRGRSPATASRAGVARPGRLPSSRDRRSQQRSVAFPALVLDGHGGVVGEVSTSSSSGFGLTASGFSQAGQAASGFSQAGPQSSSAPTQIGKRAADIAADILDDSWRRRGRALEDGGGSSSMGSVPPQSEPRLNIVKIGSYDFQMYLPRPKALLQVKSAYDPLVVGRRILSVRRRHLLPCKLALAPLCLGQ